MMFAAEVGLVSGEITGEQTVDILLPAKRLRPSRSVVPARLLPRIDGQPGEPLTIPRTQTTRHGITSLLRRDGMSDTTHFPHTSFLFSTL